MVSLANGTCADALGGDTMVDSANENQTDTKKVNGDVSFEETHSQSSKVTSSISDEGTTSEPLQKFVSLFKNVVPIPLEQIDANSTPPECNGTADSPASTQPDNDKKQSDINKQDEQLDVNDEKQPNVNDEEKQSNVNDVEKQPDVNEKADESNSVTSTSNVVNSQPLVSRVNLSTAKSDKVLKGNKIYVLNGNILKSAPLDSHQDDKYNMICLPPVEDINDLIRKMERNTPVQSLLSNVELKNMKTAVPARHGVHVKYINVKDIKHDAKLSSTPTGKAYEILRTKLMENSLNGGNQQSVTKEITTTPLIKIVDKNSSAASAPNKESEVQEESSAVSEARNEWMKSKMLLIEAAIRPKMPVKQPLPGYTGPTFSCEMCHDTFVSSESLVSHKDRRSVLLTYACPVCKSTLEFYNRCVFLLHLRGHNASISHNHNHLTVSMIPANKLNFRTLDDHENPSAWTEVGKSLASARLATTSAQTQPGSAPRRQIMMRSIEKLADPPSVRMLKSKKKRAIIAVAGQAQATVSEPEMTASAEQPPTTNSSDASVDDERKSSSDSVADDETKSEAVTQKRKPEKESASAPGSPLQPKKKRIDWMSKSSGESKPPPEPSLEKEKPFISKVTAAIEEKTNAMAARLTKIAPKPAASTIEEITLTSSDEEDVAADIDAMSKVVSCHDCHQDVTNLTKHYRGENRPRKEFPCEQCKYFNSSACALSAHVRMHTKSPPFVCPDCGYFFSTLETFLIHVKQVCFYDFKAIRFKCPECSLLKPSVTQFSEHLRRVHTRDVYKCDACMTSSYSYKVVEQHIRKMHADKSIRILEGYCCVLCPNLLISKTLLQQHVNKHVYSLQYLRYVYICKMCKKYASGRMSKFAEHYHSCLQLLSDAEKGVKSRRVAPPAPPRKPCEVEEVMEKDPLSIEEWEADKLKAEFVPTTKLCVMCRTTSLNEHSSLFCNDCVRYVDAEDVATGGGSGGGGGENVASLEVGRSKRKFKCKLCKQFMNRDWPTITKHFEQYHHSDFDVGSRIRPASSDGASPSATASRKRKPSFKVAELATAHKSPKSETKYKCVKCGLSTNDRGQFHDHIVSHKSQSNTDFQCLECGWCFIVKPSLEKHLIVVHKIRERDLKEYFRENGVPSGDDKEEERSLVENQCEVCYMVCGSKQIYDKHIRTHGMAFVAMQSKAKS